MTAAATNRCINFRRRRIADRRRAGTPCRRHMARQGAWTPRERCQPSSDGSAMKRAYPREGGDPLRLMGELNMAIERDARV
jgi:hypothetical protein